MEDKNTIDYKVSYLQMIQNIIGRMSTASAVFKGFCATIITGTFALSFTKNNKWLLIISLIPLICFCIIDIYYLQLEKRYRILYRMVKDGVHIIDFDLTPPKEKSLSREASICKCLKSPSIYLFYPPLIIIGLIIILLK